MKSKKNTEGGFIGILILFIVVAGMIFFIVRTDMFTGQKDGKSMLEVNTDALQRARDAKVQMETYGSGSIE